MNSTIVHRFILPIASERSGEQRPLSALWPRPTRPKNATDSLRDKGKVPETDARKVLVASLGYARAKTVGGLAQTGSPRFAA